MVAVNGIYRLAVIGTVNGQQHVHTLHFKSTANTTALSATEPDYQQSLIDAYQSSCRDPYRQLFHPSSSPCQTYQVRKVCGSLPLPAGVDEGETAGNSTGTGAPIGDMMAPWLAQVVTLRTGFIGRRYRGRNFIGGLFEQDVVGATIQTGRMSNAGTYYTALVTAFAPTSESTTAYRWFVFSRTLSLEAGTACQDAGANVQSYTVRDQMASMKSRKLGSGI